MNAINVRMRPDQHELVKSIFSLPPHDLKNLSNMLTKVGKARGINGLGDWENWLQDRIAPSEGFVKPYGPSNFPVAITGKVTTAEQWLEKIYNELVKQNTPTRPLVRGKLVDTTGVTLDWTASGLMSRLLIRNKGATNSVWMAFDQSGASVDNFTSNNSFEVQAQEAITIEGCAFSRLGLRCSAGTATVHAIAFPANSGKGNGAVG